MIQTKWKQGFLSFCAKTAGDRVLAWGRQTGMTTEAEEEVRLRLVAVDVIAARRQDTDAEDSSGAVVSRAERGLSDLSRRACVREIKAPNHQIKGLPRSNEENVTAPLFKRSE